MKKIIVPLFALLVLGCSKNINGHACKWENCPYKGISVAQYPLVAEGKEGSDLYYIDLLHIENPSLEYDELEDMLFRPKH